MSKTELMREYGEYLLDFKHDFGARAIPINFEEFSEWALTVFKNYDIMST